MQAIDSYIPKCTVTRFEDYRYLHVIFSSNGLSYKHFFWYRSTYSQSICGPLCGVVVESKALHVPIYNFAPKRAVVLLSINMGILFRPKGGTSCDQRIFDTHDINKVANRMDPRTNIGNS